ncbi:MAG: MFS transporter [Candidatus Roseilinea sp.]|uniref:MFS transporter n=1 Tax=Candidatus Roseilinea sp. TaxID=2838777 RepID=UPI00404913BF
MPLLSRSRWRSILPQDTLHRLQLSILLSSLGIVVITAGLPVYLSEIGATGLELGGVFAVGALTTALPRPLIGRALDLHGRKRFLVAGIAIVAVSMVLYGLARDIGTLFVASTVQGFGTGTMLLSAYAMTADLTMRSGRGGSFGSTEQSQYRGGLYGGLLAVPVLLITGFDQDGNLRITPDAWSIVFMIFALGALVGLAIALFGLGETYTPAPETGQLVGHEAIKEANKIDRQLYVLMAIVALTSASSAGIAPFILKFIQDHITQNLVLLGLAYLPASLVWGFMPSRMGMIADRFGRKLPIAVGLTTSGLFSALIPSFTTIAPLTVFAMAEALCYSAAVPAEQAFVADMTGGKRRGIGFGLYTLAQSSGRVVGPLVMGALYDQFRAGPFLANAVILLLGSALVLSMLHDPYHRRVPSASGGK